MLSWVSLQGSCGSAAGIAAESTASSSSVNWRCAMEYLARWNCAAATYRRDGAACPSTLASELTRTATPSALRISASDCADGRSGSVVSRRHSRSDIPVHCQMRDVSTMQTSPGGDLLRIRQLCRSFREGERIHHVLDGLDAEIGSGERVAVMGRSGSGKSTLLNLVSGIDRADSGAVHVNGLEVTALREPARTLFRRAHIGFVYQFFNLIPTLDVAENVRLVLELNGMRGHAARERSLAALAEVGLRDRAHSAIDTLSGGEQQSVAIARALVHAPP